MNKAGWPESGENDRLLMSRTYISTCNCGFCVSFLLLDCFFTVIIYAISNVVKVYDITGEFNEEVLTIYIYSDLDSDKVTSRGFGVLG